MSGVYEAAAALGIDVNNLDEGSDLDTEVNETEESFEETEDSEEQTSEEEISDEIEQTEENSETPEGEEQEEESTTDQVEEPQLTAKQIQEIDAAKADLEARETAFNEKVARQEQEFQEKYHEKLKTHDEIDSFFAHLAEKDPELFELVKDEFQSHLKQFSNPVIDELRKKNTDLEKKLDAVLAKTSDSVTLNKLDTELAKVKETVGKQAETAGLKVDWKKVEDTWAKNPDLGVKNAFYALYGEDLAKVTVSKEKVAEAARKVAARPKVVTSGNVSRSSAPTNESFTGMSTRDVMAHYARKVSGK